MVDEINLILSYSKLETLKSISSILNSLLSILVYCCCLVNCSTLLQAAECRAILVRWVIVLPLFVIFTSNYAIIVLRSITIECLSSISVKSLVWFFDLKLGIFILKLSRSFWDVKSSIAYITGLTWILNNNLQLNIIFICWIQNKYPYIMPRSRCSIYCFSHNLNLVKSLKGPKVKCIAIGSLVCKQMLPSFF